jgi:hypothetical protein
MSHRALTLAIAALVLVAGVAAPARAETISPSKAGDYVGREVTIEGRVVATHASPTATVVAFAPNFAGFTATILAADRAKFPPDFEDRYNGRLVQLTGRVAAYRGKPEMTIRDPSQLAIVVDPNVTATAAASPRPSPAPTPRVDVEELQRIVVGLEERVAALEARLFAAEQALSSPAPEVGRPPRFGVGASASMVRAALGDPAEIRRRGNLGDIWLYASGRSVTFDSSGRVVAWTGF